MLRLPCRVPALLLLACGPASGPVAHGILIPSGDTLIAPYGDVTDAAWLGESRWVILAPQGRSVAVVDFQERRLGRFGGRESGQLEQPFHLFRSGDSIYIGDWLRRRLTHWSLAGRLGGQTPAMDRLRGALPRGRDAGGAWYFELRAPPGTDGRGNLDSGAVVRTADAATDTILPLAPFDLAEIVSDGRRRMERRLLSGQDRWGVRSDGRVWVARLTPNRVDWRSGSGAIVLGAELPDRVLPVTRNDRDLFLSRFEPGLRPTVEQIPFTAVKPPFEAAILEGEARLWLVKSRAVGDTVRFYQVVDTTGHLVMEAEHRGLGWILAFGGGAALVGEPCTEGVRLVVFHLQADSGRGGR